MDRSFEPESATSSSTGPGARWRRTALSVSSRCASPFRTGSATVTVSTGGDRSRAAARSPLACGGRLGVLGYVLNNDPSIHLSIIERLHEAGAHSIDTVGDSFQRVTTLFSSGYPLGSYAWVLVGRTVGGVLGFHLWTPFTAL